MRRIISLILASLLALFSLSSCFGDEKGEYFERTRRDSDGRLSISLARVSKDGKELGDKALQKLYDGACNTFSASFAALSPESSSALGLFNAEYETIFDLDPAVTEQVLYAFELSDKTDGLYEPCGGTLTALLEKNPSPTKKEISKALSHVGQENFSIEDNCLKKSDPLSKIDLGALRDAVALNDTIEYLKASDCAYGIATFNGVAGVFGEKTDGSPFKISLQSGSKGSFNISEGFVSLVSEKFGTATDFSDGKLEAPIKCAAVFASDARVAASLASVAYVNGIDSLLKIYDKGELSFEAVLTQKNGEAVCTQNATRDELFVPETTTED